MQAILHPSLAAHVPGVTTRSSDVVLPGVLEAVSKKTPDERAKALTVEAEEWFKAWRWYQLEAVECKAHYNTLHWGYMDPKRLMWIGDTLDEDADRVRIAVPVTKALVDQAVAMMTQDNPIFLPVASRKGVSAAAVAEVSRAYLDQIWEHHDLDELYRDTAKWSFCTGTSFVLLEWDPTAGRDMPDPDAPPQMPAGVGADGRLAPPEPPATKPEGDLKYRTVPRENVAFDPSSRQPGGRDGVGVCIRWRETRQRLVEIAQAAGATPDVIDALRKGDKNRDIPDREEKIDRSSPAGTTRGNADDKADDSLDAIVWYLRKRAGRPRGDCILVSCGKILYAGENDIYPTADELANGELMPAEHWPLYDFIADQREGCPWGRSRTVDVIPLQHAVNGCYSKCLQHLALMANAQFVVPSGLDDDATDEVGKVWKIAPRFWKMTGGHPVQILNPPALPMYREEAEGFIQRMEYTVGVNAASLGQSPESGSSGRNTLALQARDDRRIAPLKRAHDRKWARVQTHALRLVRRHATPDKQFRLVGKDMATPIRFFKVADLSAGTEILVINDQSLPRDPQQRQMFMSNVTKDLAQNPNPDFQTAYLEAMHLPDMAEFLRRRSPHQASAIDNNRRLLMGDGDPITPGDMSGRPANCPMPQPWDNAMIHQAELERFTCSADYKEAVRSEKQNPATPGQSPLEQAATWLWTYWAQHNVPTPPVPQVKLVGQLTPAEVAPMVGAPAPPPAPPGAPPPGGPPAAAGPPSPSAPPMAKAA